MKIRIVILFIVLCYILNVFIYFITQNESRTINSILVSSTRADSTDYTGESNGSKYAEDNSESIDVDESDDSEATDVGLSIKKIDSVRALISTSNYESFYHSKISLSGSSDMIVRYGEDGEKSENIKSGRELIISADSSYFERDTITVCPAKSDGNESEIKVNTITRNCGTPEYYGSFEIIKTSEGLLLINIVPVEKYICGVVSSELNSSFHNEALKTQAVCARTYLYYISGLGKYSEYCADIEDSKNCQVYNNNEFSDEIEKVIAETEGEIITFNGNVINAVYFSTSCGATTVGQIFNKNDMDYASSIFVSNAGSVIDLTDETVFQSFIDSGGEEVFEQGDDSAVIYDSEYPYYRWSVIESLDEIRRAVESATEKDVGTINRITPGSRMDGGILSSVTVYGSSKTIVITGQDNIRRAFCKSGVSVNLNDGSVTNINSLPSAFFYFKALYDNEKLSGYELIGGGYGHGCGLSQNAAKTMAEYGMSYKEIIKFFYNDIEIVRCE